MIEHLEGGNFSPEEAFDLWRSQRPIFLIASTMACDGNGRKQ